MKVLKQHKHDYLYGACFCIMICYAVLYHQIVYHGESFLPQGFHVPFQDITEYYAILNKLNVAFILLFIIMLVLYVYVNRTIRSSVQLYLKMLSILGSLFLGMIVFGMLAFVCEIASEWMIYVLSMLLILLMLIPPIHAVFHSHKSSYTI